MKVIVSHDVDHITFSEHMWDLLIPKYIARNLIEFSLCYVSSKEMIGRIINIFQNKWQNIEELMSFNQENNIPATFFIAVENGKGLSYSLSSSKLWIERIRKAAFDVGVHGIAYMNFSDIKKEFDTFHQVSGLNNFGIRMHYLRLSNETLHFLGETGYLFDSSLYKIKGAYKSNGIWEFPLHIMDVEIIRKNSRWQNQTLFKSKETTKKLIEKAHNKNVDYLTINFHDRFFNNSFKTWKDWYIWLIEYLKNSQYEFISYQTAIEELEKTSRS